MKTKILRLLRTHPEYLSGQDLCKEMGVSRTAVWKVMNQLKEEGYEIEAIQNKGYKLNACPNVMSESEIGSRLTTEWAGKNLICLASVDSTNDEAKRRAQDGIPHGTLLVTKHQTAGRGRRGREWEADQSTTIMASLLLRPTFTPQKASMLTLVMALSILKAMEETTDLTCGIKWPNDIVIQGKKVCGILTEMNAEPDYIHYVVIGFGINVNTEEFPSGLVDKATSLKIEGQKEVNRCELLACTMKHFEQDYAAFVSRLDLSSLLEEYDAHLINKDQPVTVLEPQGEYKGIARGINELGELIVEKETGETVFVYAGEVSVRGLYGYV